MPPIFSALEIGREVIRLTKAPVTKAQLVRYAGASGDFNPLHTDDETAKKAGFEGVVAHGMLVMGIIAQGVTSWIDHRRLETLGVRFKGMTRPGDTITVRAEVIGKERSGGRGVVTCAVEAFDQQGEVKAAGTFQVALPVE